jgi:acyl-CoA thioester hydrolase
MPPPPGRRFVARDFPPRTYDIDFAGIVNNAVYIRWLEDLRLALMEEAYPIERALKDDVAPILLSTKIDYERPVTIDDKVMGRMWVPRMERVKWHVAAEFTVGERVHAAAEQVGLFIRLSTKKPIAPPEQLRAHYAADFAP